MSDPGRRNALARKGMSGTDRIATHIQNRINTTLRNSRGENPGGLGHQRATTRMHHDLRQLLEDAETGECGIPLQPAVSTAVHRGL